MVGKQWCSVYYLIQKYLYCTKLKVTTSGSQKKRNSRRLHKSTHLRGGTRGPSGLALCFLQKHVLLQKFTGSMVLGLRKPKKTLYGRYLEGPKFFLFERDEGL